VKIVSFLQAPGFCTLRSESGLFPDVRRTQALELRLRGSSGLQNYSLQIGVEGITSSQEVYAANFQLAQTSPSHQIKEERVVNVPWSAFTLTFRGKPHAGPRLSDHLDKINRVGVGTSGVAGKFKLEINGFVAVSE